MLGVGRTNALAVVGEPEALDVRKQSVAVPVAVAVVVVHDAKPKLPARRAAVFMAFPRVSLRQALEESLVVIYAGFHHELTAAQMATKILVEPIVLQRASNKLCRMSRSLAYCFGVVGVP